MSTGRRGLGGVDLPEPSTDLVDAHAVDLLLDLSRTVPDLHVIAVGPLTNVAVALQRDPGFAERVARFTIMGGSLTWGNVTPAAEFNIWCDPEAADIVFESGVPITLVGLNVTMQSIATPIGGPSFVPPVAARRRPPRTCSITTPWARAATRACRVARCMTRWRSRRSSIRHSSSSCRCGCRWSSTARTPAA